MSRHTGNDRNQTVPRWPVVLITVGLLGVTTTGFMALHASAASNLARLQAALNDAAAPAAAAAPDALAKPVMPTAPPKNADLTSLTRELTSYLSEQDGAYGVAVIDLATGQSIGINADQTFPTASTFKLPMAMYILNQVEAGKASLADQIAYTADDYEEGTGSLQGSIYEGETYSVKDLVTLAITESDNIATNMLLRRFGRENVVAYARSLGATGTAIEDGSLVSTPKDMALFMRLAHSPEGIADQELRSFLANLLNQTVFHDRVEAGVPAGVRVDHKIGTLPNVVNDVGMVYAPGRNFVIAVLSSGVDEEIAPEVIAEITRKVYDFEVAQRLAAGSPAGPPSTGQSR